MEQSVFKGCVLHLHMVFKTEAPLEGARGNAAMEKFGILLFLGLFAAHGEVVFLDFDVEIIVAESGHRHGNAVVVLALSFDIVGRVGRRIAADRIHGVDQGCKPVKADR